MSVIQISREHTLTDEQAKQIAEDMVVNLAQEFGVKYHWEGDTVKFKGAGAKGHLTLLPQQVDLRMELGFLLIPLKSKIQAAIVRRLDASLS